MDEFESAKQTFVSEAQELLRDMEAGLMRIEDEPGDAENINAVFRAAHTIKGSAGLFGLSHIVGFTHVVETLLDRIRSGTLAVEGDLVAVLLQCRDHIELMVDQLSQGIETPDADTMRRGASLQASLTEFGHALGNEAASKNSESDSVAEDHGVPAGQHLVRSAHWHISLRFGSDVLRNGMDPLSFLRYLKTLGEFVHISTLCDHMPAAAAMDAESCYLGFEIVFDSKASKPEIERVFEFVADDCQIRILPPHSEIATFRELIEALPESEMKIGDILLQSGALSRQELDTALDAQTVSLSEIEDEEAPPPGKRLGEILLEQGVVYPETVNAALEKQQKTADTRAKESRSIRIDAEKLDQLIDLVGELVIAGAGTSMLARKHGLSDVLESTSVISRLIEDIRDRSLRLRMVPIGETFSRFRRVLRDVTRELSKDIDLEIQGADTELDKSVVEKIGDPLTHLVRNAVDHGIEDAETRAKLGKPAKGTIVLNAFHDSGSIVIEVSDDGGGIDRDKVLAKAIAKGVVVAGANLSDQEVLQLIFEPGLSTAEKVSNLSGRGVGMDVVKRNVLALRGSVEVSSELGVGTTVSIRLPLTLSIIDGFLVGVGKSTYVLPLDSVVECIEFSQQRDHEGNYINLRGQVLPYLNLRQLFVEHEGETLRKSIVVVQGGGQQIGVVVDQLLGEFQTVIKPLGKLFERLRCVSGSTILGSGEVAMILDVPSLIQVAEGGQRGHGTSRFN